MASPARKLMNPPNYKLTREQAIEVNDVIEELYQAALDGIGPGGQTLGMLPDLLKSWCFHYALAGVRVVPEKALIKRRPYRDQTGMFKGAHEWVSIDTPDDPQDEAEQVAKEIEELLIERARSLSAGVRDRLVNRLQELGGATRTFTPDDNPEGATQ